MPLFAVKIINKPGAGDIRAAHLPAHHEYLATNAPILLIGGATLDEEETAATGALYILDCATFADARKFADEDPLTVSGSRSEITVSPWRTAVIDREYVFGTPKAGAAIPGQAPPKPRA